MDEGPSEIGVKGEVKNEELDEKKLVEASFHEPTLECPVAEVKEETVHEIVFQVEEIDDDPLLTSVEEMLDLKGENEDMDLRESPISVDSSLGSTTESVKECSQASESLPIPENDPTEPQGKLRRGRSRLKTRKSSSVPRPPPATTRKRREIPEKPRINRYYKYKVLEKEFSLILEVEAGEVKGNVCDKCSANFGSFKALKQHMTSDHDIALYKCSHCPDQLIEIDHIEDHMIRKHSEDEKSISSFECVSLNPHSDIWKRGPKICEEKYSYSLINHGGYRLILLSDDTRFPKFSCEVCTHNFISSKNLREHIIAKHSYSVFKCIPCDLIVDFEDLEDHLKRSHANFEKVSVFKCVDANGTNGIVADTIYSYLFLEKDEDMFNLVLTSNKKKNRFSCEKCKCIFSNESDIKIHIKEYHATLSFNCDTCNTKLDLESIETHLIRHAMFGSYFLFTSIKPVLKIQEFSTLSYILREDKGFELSLLYSTVKKSSFECSACSCEFNDDLVLEKHMTQVHFINHFKCTVCSRNYNYTSLPRHSKTHSNDNNAVFIYSCLDTNHLKIPMTHHFLYKLVLRDGAMHMSVKHAQKTDRDTFECTICWIFVTSLSEFFAHMNFNHQTKRFECNLCKVVKGGELIIEHLRMCHVLDAKVVYTFKGISDDSMLKQLSTQNSNKWSFAFNNVNNILQDAPRKFENIYCLQLIKDDCPVFDCLVCPTMRDTVLDLKEHLNKVHYSMEQYFCTVCNKVEAFKYLNLGSHDHNRDELYFLTVQELEDQSAQKEISEILEKNVIKPRTEMDNKFYSFVMSSKGTNYNLAVSEAVNFDFICKCCQVPFLSFPLLKNHLWIIHKIRTFKCTHCFEEVFTEFLITHMINKHSGEIKTHSDFICEKPEIEVMGNFKLKRLKPTPANQIKEKSIFPKECCYSFISYDGFRLIISWDKTPFFDCDVCKKKFPTKFHLQIHMKEIHSIQTSKCITCEKDVRFADIRDHIRSHRLSMNYAIFLCLDGKERPMNEYLNYSMVFIQRESQQNELFVVKKVAQDKTYECQFCTKTFEDVCVFDLHIKEIHKSSKFTCVLCTLILEFTEILRHLDNDHVTKVKTAYIFKCIEGVPMKLSDKVVYTFRLSKYQDLSYVEIEMELADNKVESFECRVCKRKMANLKSFENHIIVKHCSPNRLCCDECSFSSKPNDFLKHWIIKHKNLTKIKFVENRESSLSNKAGPSNVIVENELLTDNEEVEPEPENTEQTETDIIEDIIDIKPDPLFDFDDNSKEIVQSEDGLEDSFTDSLIDYDPIFVKQCTKKATVIKKRDELLFDFENELDDTNLEEFIDCDEFDPVDETVLVDDNDESAENSKEEENISEETGGIIEEVNEGVSGEDGHSVTNFEDFEMNSMSDITEHGEENREEPGIGTVDDVELNSKVDVKEEMDVVEEIQSNKEVVMNPKKDFEVIPSIDEINKQSTNTETSTKVKEEISEVESDLIEENVVKVKDEPPLELFDDGSSTNIEVQNEPFEEASQSSSGSNEGNKMPGKSTDVENSLNSLNELVIKRTGKLKSGIECYSIISPDDDDEKLNESSVETEEKTTVSNQDNSPLVSERSTPECQGTVSELTSSLEYKQSDEVVVDAKSGQYYTYVIYIKENQMLVESKMQETPGLSICKMCFLKIESSRLAKHIKTCHQINRDLKCVHCDMYIAPDSLDQHSRYCLNLFSYKLIGFKNNYLLSVARLGLEFLILCTVCGVGFNKTDSFRVHLKNKHRLIERFQCYICFSEFSSFNDIIVHSFKHSSKARMWLSFNVLNSNGKYVAKETVKDNVNYNLLSIHNGLFMKLNISVGKAECSICSIKYEKSFELKEHIEFIHGFKKYLCKLCNKEITFDELKDHSHKTRPNEFNYIKCITTIKLYSYRIQRAQRVVKSCPKNLEDQCCIVMQRMQTNSMQFFCCICELQFEFLNQFNQHFFEVHSSGAVKFCCLRCKVVVYLNVLYEHLNTIHNSILKISFISVHGLNIKLPKDLDSEPKTEAIQPAEKTTTVARVANPTFLKSKPKIITKIVFVPKKPAVITIHPEPKDPIPSTSNQNPTPALIETVAVPEKVSLASNLELQFNFKFTFAMNRMRDYCVFAKSSLKTEYNCLYCYDLIIRDYEHFKKHIETKHIWRSIVYSVCDACMELESIDEFEYHIMQKHLRDEKLNYCFKLISIDSSVKVDSSNPCFTFIFEINKDAKAKVCVNPTASWKFICLKCRIQFRKISHLNLHVEKTHKLKISQLKCGDCKYIFKGLIQLPRHALKDHKKPTKLEIDVQFEGNSKEPSKEIVCSNSDLGKEISKTIPIASKPTVLKSIKPVIVTTAKPNLLSQKPCFTISNVTSTSKPVSAPRPIVISTSSILPPLVKINQGLAKTSTITSGSATTNTVLSAKQSLATINTTPITKPGFSTVKPSTTTSKQDTPKIVMLRKSIVLAGNDKPLPQSSNPLITTMKRKFVRVCSKAIAGEAAISEPRPVKVARVVQNETPPETFYCLSYDIDSANDHCVMARFSQSSKSSKYLLCCKLCQVKFKELAHLRNHIETSHIHDKISYSICEKCCTVLNHMSDFTEHIRTLHSDICETSIFQFKLISMKTTVLEDVEEGLTMRDMLTPSPNFEDSEDVIALSD
ncbi:hypothetical protein ACFFRR_008880 [Megaselia abdita]